jgi:hypothetical protein
MKKVINIACLFILLLIIFGCPQETTTGSMRIILAELKGRTIQPDLDMVPETYVVKGEGPAGESFTVTSYGSEVMVNDLITGMWTITVEGFNEDDILILRGEDHAIVEPAKTTTVTVVIPPLTGNGTLDLTAQWDSNGIESPSIMAELIPYEGNPEPLDFEGDTNGIRTYYNSAIPAGYYMLIIKLFDGDVLKGGIVEVARILEGQVTSAEYPVTLTEYGALDIRIVPKQANPLEVEIKGLENGALLDGPVNVTEEVLNNDVGNVVCIWKLNDIALETGTGYTVTAEKASAIIDKEEGHNLTLEAYTVNGERTGSTSILFDILVPCTDYYYDGDGDKYGRSDDVACNPSPTGYYTALVGGDCDDGDNTINPGAPEICDGKDNDCDGQIDEQGAKGCRTYYMDSDGDGYGTSDSRCLCNPSRYYRATISGDCDDTDPNIHGCIPYYMDSDDDTYGTDDSSCLCSPSNTEPFYRAERSGDCDDGDKAINPGATEIYDGKDNDCDGYVDEDFGQGSGSITCRPGDGNTSFSLISNVILVTWSRVTVIGGGGGDGGWGCGSSAGAHIYYGGGGGAGQMIERENVIQIGTTYTVSPGRGGSGGMGNSTDYIDCPSPDGCNSNNGSPGEQSIFSGGSTTITAAAGNGASCRSGGSGYPSGTSGSRCVSSAHGPSYCDREPPEGTGGSNGSGYGKGGDGESNTGEDGQDGAIIIEWKGIIRL